MRTHPVRGKTLSLTFDDGQMAGKTIEHAFHSDGSLDFYTADTPDAKSHIAKYEVAKVTDTVYAVSYLGSGGYTLSVVLDFTSHHLVAVSSNATKMQLQRGSFAVHA